MKKLSITLLLAATALISYAQSVNSRVTFTAVDGKVYQGTITQVQGDQYKVKYDGYDFEAWMTAGQFRVIQTGAVPTAGTSTTVANPNAVRSIFDFGRNQGWTTQWQEQKLNDYLNRLNTAQYQELVRILNLANTASARFFVLKSLLGGDDFADLNRFINELNQYNESYQRERCLVTTHKSIIQQWEFSCAITVVQTFLGDICPRYAWDMKNVPDYDKPATDPYSNALGIQQKELLEKYGGGISVRGNMSGKGIPINNALNDFVGLILHKQFNTQPVGSLSNDLARVRAQLDQGIDTPMLIGFVGTEAKHFILVTRYRQTASGYQYQIYDPWDGVCDYVTEANLMQGSLSPLLTQWRISLEYYYIAS